VPRALVGLSTASVYPEGVAAAFELAARLGYDGVEVMVWTDPLTREAGALRTVRNAARINRTALRETKRTVEAPENRPLR